MNLDNAGNHAATGRTRGPKSTVVVFVLLTFLFSAMFWRLIAQLAPVAGNAPRLMIYTVSVMWCPAAAGILTRLLFQRNLKGFGFRPGQARWLLLGIFLPALVGLLMFGSAWISGIAPLNTAQLPALLAPSFALTVLLLLVFNCIAAFGEELGWRGLLVPELARGMGFTSLALLSGGIWAVWHFPLIIYGTYHGSGPLWFSCAVFVPSVMGAGLVLAWLRLASGSIWVAVVFHGFWNYFIQQFFPFFTVRTPAGERMLGEFGWFVAVAYAALALVFWCLRKRLPAPAREPT